MPAWIWSLNFYELVVRSYSPSFEAKYSVQKSSSSPHALNTAGFSENPCTQVLTECVGSVALGQGLR